MNESRSLNADWRAAGLRYYAYGFHLRSKFRQRVQKISLDAKMTCPNVDGTVAVGGCVFCDNRSFSPSRRIPQGAIQAQIDDGIRRLQKRYKVQKFIAYFQPATNTYGPIEKLRPLFEEAIADPRVVGLSIGTRPDCVEEDVLELIEELAERTYVSVEYGMQTMHDSSLAWMNRGCTHEAMLDAMERSRSRGFEICAHVMLGLPGESKTDMLATAREVARLKLDAVKIHNLYAVKNTPLVDQIESGDVRLMERAEYIDVVVDFLEQIPSNCIVERISGDAPPDYFVGPTWCLDKPGVKMAIEQELESRNTYQGRRCEVEKSADLA
ncbi:MAG: TIGR01212 family radical SAM protein [Pirellulales bacterium]|nr:TIGR01212 family radical SAM protein [Pirellulales bacterium]